VQLALQPAVEVALLHTKSQQQQQQQMFTQATQLLG
jgi:hypothetical protein